jgi:hypothetical protein
VFTYNIQEQEENIPHSRETNLDDTLDHPILSCPIIDPSPETLPRTAKSKDPMIDRPSVNRSPGEEGLDSSDDDSESEHVIGEVRLTHENSPLDKTIQDREHSWILLAREKGFKSADGAFNERPDNFPEEWLTENDSDSENGDPPWMAQLMLIRWDNDFAERVAVAYIAATAWDALVAEQGEKRLISLR